MALDVHDIRQLLYENGVEDAAVELHRRLSGLNLEDIKAPGCFEIERRLRDQLDVPVIHDDQHGTAVVVFAALLNAARVTGRKLERARVVIVGAGADGSAMAEARSQSSRPRPTRFLARHLASERRPWRPHVRGRIVSCLRGWRSFVERLAIVRLLRAPACAFFTLRRAACRCFSLAMAGLYPNAAVPNQRHAERAPPNQSATLAHSFHRVA